MYRIVEGGCVKFNAQFTESKRWLSPDFPLPQYVDRFKWGIQELEWFPLMGDEVQLYIVWGSTLGDIHQETMNL